MDRKAMTYSTSFSSSERIGFLAAAFLATLLVPMAHAQSPAGENERRPVQAQRDQAITGSAGFLEGHPDLRHRNHGITAFRLGNYQDAARHFMQAAHYADKPSQAVYAEMLWDGTGVPQDRPLAYAWMDLAAERRSITFLAKREHYWSQLDEAERARAIEVGEAVYAQYGDAIAKPRQEQVMRRARRNVTGSRVGMVGNLEILLPGPGGGVSVSGDQMYADQLWEPDQYWQWQDAVTERAMRATIRVGDLEQTHEVPAPRDDEHD